MLKQNLTNWKTAITLVLVIGMTVVFTGCAATGHAAQTVESNPNTEGHQIYPLLFNTPEVDGGVLISPAPNFDFHLNLTDEQLNAVFPKLDFDTIQIFNAEAFYTREGTLVEVVLRFGNFNRSKISIGIGGQPNTIFEDFGFGSGFIPQQSNVHGVPVTAYILQPSNTELFRTFFTIDDERFYIHLFAPDDGETLMTEIVNMTILGGTDGLDALTNPIIPELRFEALTISEAMEDEVFGAFVPTNIPYGFEPRTISRSVQGHVNENRLLMDWERQRDKDYLYALYTAWVNEWAYTHNFDIEPYPFEDVFWSNHSLRLVASKVITCENGNVITWHSPMFLAEEFTFDDVLEQAITREWISQGVDGAGIPEHLTDYLFIRYPVTVTEFSVLFGDVLVSVRSNGLSAQQVWDLFADIKDNLQNTYDESCEVSNALDYNAFLELLEANGFVFETRDGHPLNDAHRRVIYIGGERLVVYCGNILTGALEPPTTQITWINEARWPTRDSVSVIYSGDNDRIIEFLNNIFGDNPARQGR